MAVIFEQTVERLKRLLFDRIAENERIQLEKELNRGRGGEAYKRLREKGYIGRRLEEYETWDEQKAFRRFVNRVTDRKVRIRRWMWSGAVASVACIIGIILFIQKEELDVKGDSKKVVRLENEVISPGKVKAMLKLGNGEVVQVADDSMRIGGVAGGQITYNNGKLEYRTEERVAEIVYNELEVPVGGECNILLEDGTRVWMNAASSLRYPEQFVGDERRVYLVGEAFFDVAKDGKPFIVNTELGDVQVLGTEFNVKAYTEELEMQTTLVKGKVRVYAKNRQSEIELVPGEQAVTIDGQIEKRQVDVDEFIGWYKGVYVFRYQTLGNIMKDLERWYGVTVFFQNAELKEVSFTGNLKRYDNINAFMEILQRTGDVKYTINNNTVIIYK